MKVKQLIVLIKATLKARLIFIKNGDNCKLYQNVDLFGKRRVGCYQVNFNNNRDDINYDVRFGNPTNDDKVFASVNFNGNKTTEVKD